MKKEVYYIATNKGKRLVEGRTFEYEGVKFGIHNRGSEKYKCYSVDHIESGLRCCPEDYFTYKSAYDGFVENWADMVIEKLRTKAGQEAIAKGKEIINAE